MLRGRMDNSMPSDSVSRVDSCHMLDLLNSPDYKARAFGLFIDSRRQSFEGRGNIWFLGRKPLVQFLKHENHLILEQ